MWKSTIAPTKPAAPSHCVWVPVPPKPDETASQAGAVDFLCSQGIAAIWADPGAGKTAITLAAFLRLKKAGQAKRMLVVGTLRICQLTWRQEAAQWTQFKDLKFAFLHGDKKLDILRAALADDTEIFLINYDGLEWLSSLFPGRQLPFDIVVCDEITKLKNYKSVRSKKFRPVTTRTRWKWALTGTPSPNGYMDLFGQWLWMDGGGALGRFITHYRDMFFKQDYNGFKWVLQDGGAERVEKRVQPYVYRLPYVVKSGLVPNPIYIEMSKAARKVYTQVKNDFLAELPEGKITAGNQAAAYSKLSQMANGAVYINGGADVLVLHDDKLDALEELLDELGGKQLMVAYEFQHDLTRIQERMKKRYGKEVPFLGAGVSGKRAEEIQDAWNNGMIPVLLVHPQSAGHGLNLQKGGACHICWFSVTWDLELWEQLIRRLWRRGNSSDVVTNHILIVRNTIDELKLDAVDGKGKDQAQLLQSMVSLLVDTPAVGARTDQMETNMTRGFATRLPDGPEANTAAPAPQSAQAGFVPKGWGQRAAAPAPEQAVDRGQVESRITQAPPPSPPAPPAPIPQQFIQQGDAARDVAQRAQDDQPTSTAPKPFAGFSSAVQSAVGAAPATEQQNEPAPVQTVQSEPVETTRRTPKPRTAAPAPDKAAGPATATSAPDATTATNDNGLRHVNISISGDVDTVKAMLRALASAA